MKIFKETGTIKKIFINITASICAFVILYFLGIAKFDIKSINLYFLSPMIFIYLYEKWRESKS